VLLERNKNRNSGVLFHSADVGPECHGRNQGRSRGPGRRRGAERKRYADQRWHRADLKAATNATGVFVFPSVADGTYKLELESSDFRKYVRSGIVLTASEIRDLGSCQLVLGELRETVSVADTVTPLQTASGERSGLVSGAQLNNLALKGRDFMGLATLMPGVVDDGSVARQTTAAGAPAAVPATRSRTCSGP
jgi:hypothetical protein